MGDHSQHHHHRHRSMSTDLYGILGMSKASSIKDMSCKAYKSLVNKWYPDHRSTPSKTEEEGSFKDIDDAYEVCTSNFHANSSLYIRISPAYTFSFSFSLVFLIMSCMEGIKEHMLMFAFIPISDRQWQDARREI